MNPLHLIARNYRSFDMLDVDLPDGCVAILGENGAGKSSIVNAVDLAIFGPESRSLADALTEGVTDDDLLVELVFEHAGEVFRVRRTFSARGRGRTTLDFEHALDLNRPEDSAWEPLTCESAKETQARIERTIGLSRETFRASAFLAQGDGAAFTEAQPRDRKKILAEVLGLEQWTVLADRARVERRDLDAKLQQLAGRVGQAEEQAAALPELERDYATVAEAETVAADNVADLERSREELAGQYQAAREHASRRAAAVAELKTVESEHGALTVRSQEALKAAHARAETVAALEQLPAVEAVGHLEEIAARHTAVIEEHRAATVERERIVQAARDMQQQRDSLLDRAKAAKARADEINTQISHIEDGHLDECPTCKQALGAEARTETVQTLTAQAVAAGDEMRQLRLEADAVTIPEVPAELEPPLESQEGLKRTNELLEGARTAVAQRGILEERILRYDETAAAAPSPDEVVASQTLLLEKRDAVAAAGEPADTAAIETQGTLVSEQLRTARASLEQHKTQRARLEERIVVATAAAEQLQAIAGERVTLTAESDLIVALERAFSPDGVPALIVENSAIPYLETEANRILAELGTVFRVELRTQAALKSGEGLRDTLDVIVCSETGERAYETFSGGEKTRLNLALRIALARLLAHRRGAESRLLCIDEPEFLDEQGTAALVEVLRGLEGDFDKLYVVSHVPALRDSFDTTLTVVRDEAGSRVAEAGVFEAVPA